MVYHILLQYDLIVTEDGEKVSLPPWAGRKEQI